ncbi:putative ABC transporter permease/ATP-binding protein [Gordonia polyisoprenivorans NBRC 16320 = JCM 10675]|uniref:ABC transporter ATP-binding protein n=1 Tax=Gordonia polyisoprenivorans TaxID=84595 RepID=A0A846WI00_9ACTN|nr:ABC transporter ATP-binding protein [Gordonia polyisoprenivorans]NKY00676.1 ABC transporter ATP-binding protein [Gordonia polyisoprenivorans]GAB22826.1 putative ABC transporter permease/ATP-binding protein [Gordonia polyisoprenivorans NBRC 16320 = JCM 10675]
MSRTPDRAAAALLRDAVRRNRGAVAVGSVLLCVYQAAEAAVPVLLGVIIDRAMTSGSWWAPVISIAALGAVITCVSVSWRTAYRGLQRANAGHVRHLRAMLSAKVITARDNDSPLSRDEYVTVIAEDTAQASDIIEVIPVTISSAVGVLAGAVVLTVIDPLLGSVALVSTVLLLAALNLLSRKVTHRTEEQQELIARATGAVADLLRGLRPLSGFAGRGPAYDRYRTLSATTRSHAERLARISGVYEGISAGAAALLVGVVGTLAGVRAFSGDISIGDLVAVVGLSQFIAEPLGQLSRMPRFAALARGSARRVVLLGSGRTGEGGAPVTTPAPSGTVHRSTHPDLLVQVDTTEIAVTAGALVAVDCTTDQAARVATALAAGPDAPPEAPSISVRGTEIGDLDAAGLRRVVLADARHPAIFGGRLGAVVHPDGTHYEPGSEPADILTELGLDELVDDAAALLDHPVADRGGNLSGGQRQRVALARALHANPDILVLVDPTSAVDAVTSAITADTVRRRRRGKTTLVLAASPAFLRLADNVVSLGDKQRLG